MDYFVIGFVVFAIYSVVMFLFGKDYGKQCMTSFIEKNYPEAFHEIVFGVRNRTSAIINKDVWYVVWSTNPDAEFDMIPYKNATPREIKESLYQGTYEECDKWCEKKADLVDTKNHCWKEE